MATQIQFRRGTAAQHNAFTGATAEVTVNTTNKSLHVHDGTTAGGFELAKVDLSNTSSLSLSGLTTVSSLKVSNDLYVSGVSTFVGAVTFQGGTITLGDANTDNVVFTADVNSNIIPNTDATYDFGSGSQRWRNAIFSGIVTATTFSGTATSTTNVPNLTGDVTSNNTVTTLATVNSNVGTFGSSTSIPSITVNSKGLITGVTTNSIIVGDGTLTLATSGTGLSGSASFTANQSGSSTFTVTSNATNANTASTLVSRDSSGNFIAGVITATTFSGSLQGNASTATALQNSRTFEITGDVLASAISFDGTGNVSFAATIQPNSVALGSDTTGDYVQSLTGTSNQITVTGGTGETSTPTLSIPNQFTAPQDVTVTRDLQVNRNLNVNGNITIGGTAATLFTTEFKVYDPDIVLGFRTDTNGNDISTDNTANHGGVAIASTEGNPLIQLYSTGIGETNPTTYKKFMWFKSGSFSGLGTDTWVSNYAISIGNTSSVKNNSRLTVGAGFTVYDNYIDVQNIKSSNINSVGIVTAVDFNATSDINLKENIRPIDNSAQIINELEGVRFVWKADGKESIGVIAQEIEKTLPELVSNGDIKTVNYNGLIGVLIEAVKDQHKQINELKIEIENLKK